MGQRSSHRCWCLRYAQQSPLCILPCWKAQSRENRKLSKHAMLSSSGAHVCPCMFRRECVFAIFSSSRDIPFKCISRLFKHGLALDEHSRHAQTLCLHSRHSHSFNSLNILKHTVYTHGWCHLDHRNILDWMILSRIYPVQWLKHGTSSCTSGKNTAPAAGFSSYPQTWQCWKLQLQYAVEPASWCTTSVSKRQEVYKLTTCYPHSKTACSYCNNAKRAYMMHHHGIFADAWQDPKYSAASPTAWLCWHSDNWWPAWTSECFVNAASRSRQARLAGCWSDVLQPS